MAFTYKLDSADPAEVLISQVRLAIGDNRNCDDPILQDAEIQDALDKGSSVESASIIACEYILAQLAIGADVNQSGLNQVRSQKFEQYSELCKKLRRNLSIATGGAIYTGANVANTQTNDRDTNFQKPSFRVGQDDSIRNTNQAPRGQDEDSNLP